MLFDTSLRSVLRGASAAFAARVVFVAASFIATSLIALAYGPSAVGVVATLTTIMTLGSIVANLGTSSSVSYFLAAELETGTGQSARRVYRRILGICLFGNFVACGLLLIAFGSFQEILVGGIQNVAAWVLGIFAIVGVAARLFSEITALSIRALNDVPAYSVLIALPSVFNLAVLACSIWADLGPISAVAALVGGFGVSTLVGLVWVEFRLMQLTDGRPEFDSPSITYIVQKSTPMLISTICSTIVTSVGLILMPILAGHEATGQLSVAARMATITSIVLMSINVITTPMFARLHALENSVELLRLARRTSRVMLWTVAPLTFFLLVFGESLIRVAFGPEFRPAYVAMAIMLLAQLFNAFTGPSDFLMNMSQMQKALRNIIFPAAILAIALNVALIPKLGINGAAISYSVSLVTWNTAAALYIRYKLGGWIFYIPFVSPIKR